MLILKGQRGLKSMMETFILKILAKEEQIKPKQVEGRK